MTTELTIGAINPGYGGLPIGVAAALGGATLAWHAHPGQGADCPARTVMRYYHPRAGEHALPAAMPTMVDVLTINRYASWQTTGAALIDAGYKPPLVIAEVQDPNDEAVQICMDLNDHGYRTIWQTMHASAVGAPHMRGRAYSIGVRNDCDAYRWAQDDLEGHANKALTRAREHWEKVTGERYPYPLYALPTTTEAGRLSIGFVEWMMGLPIGYVSTPSLHLSHDQRMDLLYSGTVPLQAAHAVAVSLTQMGDQ